jgi:hypothetical protein
MIWFDTVDEHEHNVHTVLQVLRIAHLYVNPDKTYLFSTEIDFLGHHISPCGIEANTKKVEHVLNWPEPKSATDVCGFLGLVQYIAVFLPAIADHTGILTKLTMKDSEKNFPLWTLKYQIMFDTIKAIVTGQDCLTTINFTKMPEFFFL